MSRNVDIGDNVMGLSAPAASFPARHWCPSSLRRRCERQLCAGSGVCKVRAGFPTAAFRVACSESLVSAPFEKAALNSNGSDVKVDLVVYRRQSNMK